MDRKANLAAILATGLLAGSAGGCATGYALANPDDDPNRIFAGTRISAAHDPSSLVGDVLVLPVTVPHTLVNWAAGRFRAAEQNRAEAYAAWEAERSRAAPLTAVVTPDGTYPDTGAYRSFEVKFHWEVHSVGRSDLSLSRDGADVPLVGVGQGQDPADPTEYVFTFPPDLTTPPGRYVLTLVAARSGISSVRYALPLRADASFAWTRDAAGSAASVPAAAPGAVPSP